MPSADRPAGQARRRPRVPAAVTVPALAVLAACSPGEPPACPGDWLDATTEHIVGEELREAGGRVAAGRRELEAVAAAVDRYHASQAVPVEDRFPCHDSFEGEMTYVIVMGELAARPALASPELLTALVRAGEDRGIGGVFDVVAGIGPDTAAPPGLDELQDLVRPHGVDIVARERELRARVEAADR
jgi:hypothetical protein